MKLARPGTAARVPSIRAVQAKVAQCLDDVVGLGGAEWAAPVQRRLAQERTHPRTTEALNRNGAFRAEAWTASTVLCS